jgi:putative membrane protein
MRRLWPPPRRLVSLLLTVALLLGLVAAFSLIQGVGEAALRALPALPLAMAVHVAQLAATAMAWRGLFHAPAPGFPLMLRARWIRESLNGLLPLVGIGGGVLAASAIARQTGRPFGGVAAAATVDLMIEAVTQLPFLLIGLAIFAAFAPGTLSPMQIGALLLPLVLAALFVGALSLGLGREAVLRLAGRFGFGRQIEALGETLRVVNAGPGPVARGAAWHFLAWSLGALEVWLILAMLGTPVGLAEAYAIESLGLAARSLGFILPAGLGAQEAGLAAVALAFGVPLQEAVALAMLKRLREVAMNLPGLIAWNWIERRAARDG